MTIRLLLRSLTLSMILVILSTLLLANSIDGERVVLFPHEIVRYLAPLVALFILTSDSVLPDGKLSDWVRKARNLLIGFVRRSEPGKDRKTKHQN